MNPIDRNTWRSALGVLLAWGLGSASVEADEVTISARYRASGFDFENTTPQAGFCSRWPQRCGEMFTVPLPVRYDKTTIHGASDISDRFYIRVPGKRSTRVTSETGVSYEVAFEILAVSQLVTSSTDRSPVFTASVGGGCSYLQTYGGPGLASWAQYLWRVGNPQSPQACHSGHQSGSAGDVRQNAMTEFGIGYRLSGPSPLQMKHGVYRGQITYTVGEGAEFDLGNQVTNLNSPTLTINFELDVAHSFVLEFAPGSERAVLEPPNGWTDWLNRGRKPQRLYRDQPFRIWSSGPFKVYARCQYDLGGQCGIRSASGHEVPLEVALTLPRGIEHAGAPVNKVSVPVGQAAALAFDSAAPALNRPGQLHFAVAAEQVVGMLAHSGSTYEGDVTLIFDAEL